MFYLSLTTSVLPVWEGTGEALLLRILMIVYLTCCYLATYTDPAIEKEFKLSTETRILDMEEADAVDSLYGVESEVTFLTVLCNAKPIQHWVVQIFNDLEFSATDKDCVAAFHYVIPLFIESEGGSPPVVLAKHLLILQFGILGYILGLEFSGSFSEFSPFRVDFSWFRCRLPQCLSRVSAQQFVYGPAMHDLLTTITGNIRLRKHVSLMTH
nr:hypothetical protein Iba_chr13aCG13660 [Ipomoea batatas]